MNKLLRAVRKGSGYARGYLWEPGMDFSQHSNRPFKPAYLSAENAPSAEEAEKWAGDMGTWDDALKRAKVGMTLDFYVSKLNFGGQVEELETNVHVWLLSETKAWVQDCGSKPYLISL